MASSEVSRSIHHVLSRLKEHLQPLDPSDVAATRPHQIEVNPNNRREMESHGYVYHEPLPGTRREPFYKWKLGRTPTYKSPQPEPKEKGRDRTGYVLFGTLKTEPTEFIQALEELEAHLHQHGHAVNVYQQGALVALHPFFEHAYGQGPNAVDIENAWFGKRKGTAK
ncbi:hypothetical protein HYV43_03005 [Candidatus Micrarchaeota archaeon]|nr:hypothetical protein [Candidatus Micrarchaeota archaeon]